MSSKVSSTPSQSDDERTASSWPKVRRLVQKMFSMPSALTVLGLLAITAYFELRLKSAIASGAMLTARDDIVEEADARRLLNPRRLSVGNILAYNSASLSQAAGCVTVSMTANVALDVSTLACGSSNRVCPPCYALTGTAAALKLTISKCSTAYVSPRAKLSTSESTATTPQTTIGGQSFTFINLHATYVLKVSDGTNDYSIGPGTIAQAFCYSSSSDALYFAHRFDSIDIDGGTIDGVTIGASSAPTVTNLGSVATCDINGGTIDGVTIGAGSAPTVTNLGAVATCDINGGTIDGVTIGASFAPTVTNLGAVATCDINGGTIDGVTIGATTAPTVTNLGSVTTCDINGGTIDGVTMGASATVTLSTNTAMTGGTINGVTIGGTSIVTLSSFTAMTGGTIDGTSIGSSTPSTVIGTTVKFSTASGLLDNAGTMILTTQQAAVVDATDAATAITQLNSLLARLRTHGLIAR